VRTNESPRPMLGLVTGGRDESGSASSNFGPVRAGLTTTHRTQLAQLEASLRCLESEVENLRSKSCEAYVTLINVTEHLARLTALLLPTNITDDVE
jgi:hypothetical protein